MTDDILAGIRTAIDHGAKALMPVIDRMIEWADTLDGSERTTALRQAELLRWMMRNVERVDTAGVLRMWCEFPCDDAMDLIIPSGPLRTHDIYESITELFQDAEFGWRSGGYIVPTTLAAWVGEACQACRGNGDTWYFFCLSCKGSGRVNAVGPRAVLAAPIRELTPGDVISWQQEGNLYEPMLPYDLRIMPPEIDKVISDRGRHSTYPTPEAARAAVSTAALNWARRQAGMQHNIEGRRFDTPHRRPASVAGGERQTAWRTPR